MTIVGVHFAKIDVEKNNTTQGKVNISNNVLIKNVQEANLSLGLSDQKGAKFSFEFKSSYEPEMGYIFLSGDVLMVEDEKTISNIVSEWDSKKTIKAEIMSQVLNSVLNKCNIQALILSQTMNLPSPIPMPKVQDQTKVVKTKKD
jgi:hypothetical protein